MECELLLSVLLYVAHNCPVRADKKLSLVRAVGLSMIYFNWFKSLGWIQRTFLTSFFSLATAFTVRDIDSVVDSVVNMEWG